MNSQSKVNTNANDKKIIHKCIPPVEMFLVPLGKTQFKYRMYLFIINVQVMCRIHKHCCAHLWQRS